ncbi:hypothetical protein [Desulfofundulus kuznetsovii]
MDDYKDYLLNRHYFLEELRENEAVRVIHVPFDRERYVKWLQDNPHWEDGAEARSAWALEVAKDPAALEEVRFRYPVLPAPPLDEEFTVLVLYGVIPVVMETPDEIPAVSGRLPHEDVKQIALEAREFFSGVPEFKWLSPLRCRGVRIYAGERLVAPPKAGTFENYVNDAVREMLNAGEIVIPVPPACRVRRSDLEDDLTGERPLLVLLLFPVVLAGAASEVDYCEDLVEESEGKIGPVSEHLREMLRDKLGHDGVGEPLFVPEYALGMFLERIIESMDFELEDIDGVVENAGKGKKNRNGLKRIK